jgi:hypothetical protein
MRVVRSFVLIAALVAAIGAVSIALAGAATPTAPVVTTAAATNVTDTAATLHGTVNPEGQQTQYAFQWGPTAGYGHETTLTSAGAGSSPSAASAVLTNLAPGSTFHFRTIAINSSGEASFGADQTFKTTGTPPAPSTPPTAGTGGASHIGGTSATLAGTVNPSGQTTTYYFEYGTTGNYGVETTAVNAGAGSTVTSASTDLVGLRAGTTYHYRLVAFSAGGTTMGADQTLKTLSPPAVATGGASKVDTSSLILSGTVNPEGNATTYYFQFGTTTGYGLQTTPVNAGSGNGNVAVHRHPEGLIANTTYHYRLVAQSAGGISFGADRSVRTTGTRQIPSRLAVLGRMGFVSRSGWVGVAMGCFAGQTRCSGAFTLRHGRSVIARRNFSMRPTNGDFENVRLASKGRRLFGRHYRRPVSVRVEVMTTSGQHISQTIRLARWG